MSSDSTVIVTVLTSAGIRDTFSLLYSQAKRLGVRYGMPFTRMYAMRKKSVITVRNADSETRTSSTNDSGLFLYAFKRCLKL